MTSWASGGAVAWLLLAAGCVTGSYNRVLVDEPLRREQVEGLQPGRDDLGSCLGALGAPQRVFEYRVGADRRSGVALLWTWRDVAGWGIDVSAGTDEASANFSFNQDQADQPGCVLWFDPELRLERVRWGLVGELLPDRVRPAPAVEG